MPGSRCHGWQIRWRGLDSERLLEVYKEKGNGFLEAVYQECLAQEVDEQEIPFQEVTNYLKATGIRSP
jgi:alpha-amylase/alpha-mannosidase (GH57 family)